MPPERFDTEALSFAGMSQAVRHGDLVHVSGQVALAPGGELVGEGDIEAQVRQALANLEAALAAAGARVEDTIKVTCFLLDAAHYPAYAAAKAELFGDSAPASTCVVVKGLLDPRMLIEVEAVAATGPAGS
ncbi:MAG TPA: RidA family protein [Solirubrobacterales bacterium]|nr:RidA family protein [Solirubrobacterales bacterium]